MRKAADPGAVGWLGATKKTVTFVSTSQSKRGFPAKVALAREVQTFDVKALEGLKEWGALWVRSQQSFEFGGVDDCHRLPAPDGHVLRSLIMGAPDDLTNLAFASSSLQVGRGPCGAVGAGDPF